MARSNLECMFCTNTPCTCNKRKATTPKVTKPSPKPAEETPAAPAPPTVTPPKRPSFTAIKRVGRPVTTVAAPVLQPEAPPEPAPPATQPTKAASPRPPARPTVKPFVRAARPNLASVRRVPTNPEEEALKAALQVFIDAGFTVERLS